MQENYIIDVSMIGLDGSPRVYDNIHPCITQRLHKEPTMICSVKKIMLQERIDAVDKQNKIISTAMQEIRFGCLSNGTGGNFAGQVFDSNGLSPTLTDMQGGGRQPHIVEVKKLDVNELGFIDNSTGKHQSNTVFSTDAVSPTITTIQGGGTQQIKIVETKQLGHLEKGTGKHQSNIVYDKNGTSPCICAGMGVKQQPTMIVEEQKLCCAMRGRNPDNPSDRTKGIELEQTLEIRQDDCCGCLTSVQKDNLVLEKKTIKIRQATKDGFIDCEIGGGGGLGLSVKPNTQRSSDRERSDMSDTDNGEYP